MRNQLQLDVPVLLIFFCRSDVFQQVFDCVKRAKPKKLYLYQDGAREGNSNDIIGIQKCREIAADIDWECEVHHYFQEKNVGCDPSEYIAQKWMFDQEEMGIVLEDDDVVSDSFFPFCQELLVKYKDDERINIICGMNHFGTYDKPRADYFFTTTGAITGWASWKRVIDSWDPDCSYFEDPYLMDCLKSILGKKYETCRTTWHKQKLTGKAHYEGLLGASTFLNNRLNIVPTKNMVKNIGLTDDATHSFVNTIYQLPRNVRCIFFAKTYEYEFPLKHPRYVVNDEFYREKLDKKLGGNFFVRFCRRIEGRLYRIFPALGRL